jgi:hypothetical protein
MNKYLNLFNTLIHDQNLDFMSALLQVIEQYAKADAIKDALPEEKRKLQNALQGFYDHLNHIVDENIIVNKIGSIVSSYKFDIKMPEDFISFFEAAKKEELAALIEVQAEKSSSPLVNEGENAVAAAAFSPEGIFAQTAILERALKNNQIARQSHIDQVKAKIAEWTKELYKKFAEVILASTDLENLNQLIEEKFNDDLIKDLPKLTDFKDEIMGQIYFLQRKDFFKFFYSEPGLADKYDFVHEFYVKAKSELAEQNQTLEPELKITLSSLFYKIEERVYQPIHSKQFELMDAKQNRSVKKVFEALNIWVDKECEDFKDMDLYQTLQAKLKKQQDEFKIWEEASHRLFDKSNTYRTYEVPMWKLYQMRFAGDPKQDPRELLARLPKPMPLSPVKQKPQPAVSVEQTPALLPAATQPSIVSIPDLTTDEKLSWSDFSDDENVELIKENKHSKARAKTVK